MSEYQYYEFLAIDRPLSPTEIKELRKLSTRAEITSTRFTNTYHWGSFGGSPSDMVEKYFDAHVYVANWGTRILMLRFPCGMIDEDLLREYCLDDPMAFCVTDEHVIISWNYESEPEGWWEEGEGWMDQLIHIRTELENGDYRPLYIGWLLAISIGLPDDDSVEPDIPPGLDSLTAAQQSLVEFLEIDEDLVAAAAMASEPLSLKIDQTEDMRAWINQLQDDEMRQMLLRIMSEEPQHVLREFRQRYNQFLQRVKTSDTKDAEDSRRTVQQLFQLTEEVRRRREEREALELQRKHAAEERKRKAYLTELAKQFPKTWKEVELFVEGKTSKTYEQAVVLLVDLSDAYEQAGRADEFKIQFSGFISKYKSRSAFVRKMREAGLPV